MKLPVHGCYTRLAGGHPFAYVTPGCREDEAAMAGLTFGDLGPVLDKAAPQPERATLGPLLAAGVICSLTSASTD
jgi:hypothetical protein